MESENFSDSFHKILSIVTGWKFHLFLNGKVLYLWIYRMIKRCIRLRRNRANAETFGLLNMYFTSSNHANYVIL